MKELDIDTHPSLYLLCVKGLGGSDGFVTPSFMGARVAGHGGAIANDMSMVRARETTRMYNLVLCAVLRFTY